MSNFWRSLDLSLIKSETEINLTWSKKCIISEISITPRIAGNPNARLPVQAREARQTTWATFLINNDKPHVPDVTLSINDNNKFLENMKQGFKRTISWNKYRSEITTQPKSNNLDYLIDPTFRNINRLFFLSLKNGNNNPTKTIPLAEIKDFNALIDNKQFFNQSVKNKQEAYESLLKCQEMMTIQQKTY